jgi:hypothetical protein
MDKGGSSRTKSPPVDGSEMRILIALEPRTYREAIGNAIRELRPHLEVTLVEPDMLCSEVAHLSPQIVLWSQRKPIDGTGGIVWIEYRPYTEPKAAIHRAGQCWRLDVFDLADLLTVMDLAESLVAQTNRYPEASDSER